MKKRRLLITGFDPFGGADINPAWEAVALLPDTIGDFELCKCRIPTAFGEAAWVGFIHVPYLPEQGSPSLSVENSAC